MKKIMDRRKIIKERHKKINIQKDRKKHYKINE